jgi:O-antigen/teichoic acid export membrane protein
MSLLKHSSALAVAGIVEYLAQLLLPVVLVRHLSMAEFGEYRLVWLIASTALVIFPFFMPRTLFYFLPRLAEDARPRLIGNTVLFLMLAGLLAGFALWAVTSVMSEALASLVSAHIAVPVFVALWVMASLFDTVAVADGRAILQARATILLSVVRAAALAGVAISIGDLASLLVVMCVFAAVKFAFAAGYGAWVPPRQGIRLDWNLMRQQVTYAAPFAVGHALYMLRGQADQWVVASVFPAEVFALISIAAVVMGLANLVKQPMRNAILPPLGRLLAAEDTHKAADLITRGNAAMIMLLLPFLAWLFVCAPDLVRLVYTEAYSNATPLMQFYIVGLAASVVGGGYLLAAFDAGRVAVVISTANLFLSIVLSFAGAQLFGLHGALAGSVASLIIGEYWALMVIARKLNCCVWRLCEVSLALRAYGATVCAAAVAMVGVYWWGGASVWRILIGSLIFLTSLAVFVVALRLDRDGKLLFAVLRAPLPDSK